MSLQQTDTLSQTDNTACEQKCKVNPSENKCIISIIQTLNIMEMRIESLLAYWDEKLPELFISLVNAVAILSEDKDFKRLFAYGYGSSHLWLKQRLITDSRKIMDNRLMIVEF